MPVRGVTMMGPLNRIHIAAASAVLLMSTVSCTHSPPSPIKRISPMPPVTRATNEPGNYFFGYYGIDPWCASEKYLVCMQVPFQDRIPAAGDTARICLVELATGKVIHVAKTVAWNFQQGAMLHWMPTSSDTLIIYNDRRDQRFISIVLNVFTGERRELPLPISALSHSGTYAASINFARIYDMRAGYGYATEESGTGSKIEDPKNDGLYVMNTKDGSYSLIVSFDRANELLGSPVDSTGKPLWFNHTIFNTDDSRIFFLARIMKKTAGWNTAGLTVNLDGSDLRCILPFNWAASHFDWKSPTEIYVTTFYEGGKDLAYVIVTDGKQEYKVIAQGVLTRDGHGSFSPDRRWMVSDTYPDKKNMRSLLLINMETEDVFELGRFYSNPKQHGEFRCDLHPRWNHDGTKICFDSIHEGNRNVYIMDVSGIVRERPDSADVAK
jgi:hypothetical protein